MDIRLFRDAIDPQQSNTFQEDSGRILDWAFAGTSRTSAKHNEQGILVCQHSVWEHWIDSKTDTPSLDEGDMYTLPDGDVLEQGSQLDPVTGAEVTYEELWGDDQVQVVGEEEKRVSMVLKLDDRERNTRGLVVRVGQYCQGIVQEGNKLTVERWEWMNADDSTPGGRWNCQVRIGHGSLPCDQATHISSVDKDVTTGIQSGALEWRVMEDYCW